MTTSDYVSDPALCVVGWGASTWYQYQYGTGTVERVVTTRSLTPEIKCYLESLPYRNLPYVD
jgi:hypothetical protein